MQLEFTVTLGRRSLTTLVELLSTAIEEGTRHRKQDRAATLKTRESSEEPPRRKMPPLDASTHALFAGEKPPDDTGLLIDSRQASKLLGVSPRKLWAMYNSGEMPKPTRIGRAVRWGYEEIRAWVNAGCPPQDKWKWPA
jgi:predicted DNA-binding transcriptional regulator AlpA